MFRPGVVAERAVDEEDEEEDEVGEPRQAPLPHRRRTPAEPTVLYMPYDCLMYAIDCLICLKRGIDCLICSIDCLICVRSTRRMRRKMK